MYLGLWGLWGFYNSVELTFISWRRRTFLVGKILINTRILWNPFLIGIPVIRVNRGVQDRHSWRPSKAHVGPIISFFLPIGFFLLASFEYTYHLIQMSSSIEMKSLAYGIVIFMPPYVQVKLTGLLGPVGFLVCKRVYSIPESPLSAALLHGSVGFSWRVMEFNL